MANKALFMETTNKNPTETIGEIQKLLSNHGMKHAMLQFDELGNVVAMSFTLHNNPTPYILPAKYQPIMKLAERGKTGYKKTATEDQARKVAWRQVYRWIEAQLAMVEIEMVEIEEVFLPYMMVDKDKTVYQIVKEKGFKLLSSGEE